MIGCSIKRDARECNDRVYIQSSRCDCKCRQQFYTNNLILCKEELTATSRNNGGKQQKEYDRNKNCHIKLNFGPNEPVQEVLVRFSCVTKFNWKTSEQYVTLNDVNLGRMIQFSKSESCCSPLQNQEFQTERKPDRSSKR